MLSSAILRQFINNKPFSRVIVRNFVVGRNLNKNNNIKRLNIKHFIKGTLIGITAGAIAYDGYNAFQVYGGVTRFIRSLKIAALISIDYSWHLYGLKDGIEEYEKVRPKLSILLFIVAHKI